MIKLYRDRTSATAPVESVPVPPASLAARAFATTHYADAFRLRLPDGAPDDIDALVSLLATSSPAWVDALMTLRNRIVWTIGLRTPRGRVFGDPPAAAARRYERGDSAGIFRVYARTGDEILMGGDDRHLDFRASMIVQRDAKGVYAVLSTVVHYNNLLGRLYFVPVRPFHRMIIPAVLRRMHARLAEGAGLGAQSSGGRALD